MEAAGYSVVRSAASEGAWDLVCIGPSDIVLLQVKSRDAPYGEEKHILKEFVCPPNCRKLVHVWKERAREPIVIEV